MFFILEIKQFEDEKIMMSPVLMRLEKVIISAKVLGESSIVDV